MSIVYELIWRIYDGLLRFFRYVNIHDALSESQITNLAVILPNESYRHIVEAFLRPAFGTYRVRRLQAEDVDTFLGNLSRTFNPKTKKPYAASYVAKIYTVLRRALNLAQRWGYVGFNAAAQAEPPKVSKKRIKPPSDAQIETVLRVVAGHRYAPIYHLLVVTGLRRSEVVRYWGYCGRTSILMLGYSTKPPVAIATKGFLMLYSMVPRTRLELVTPAFSVRCSTN